LLPSTSLPAGRPNRSFLALCTARRRETYFAEVVLQRHEAWVAVDESGGLVGLLALDGNWVEQLYVHPAETGRGIGSRLLERAKSGRQLLELWTFQANAGARRFYERHCFRAVATTDGDNEEGAPDVRYRWERGTAV
jgi:GNAT superfamily N-acetyltransferase